MTRPVARDEAMSRPIDSPVEDDGVTTLQEDILLLLEAARIPTGYCDQIIHLIMMGEREREALVVESKA